VAPRHGEHQVGAVGGQHRGRDSSGHVSADVDTQFGCGAYGIGIDGKACGASSGRGDSEVEASIG